MALWGCEAVGRPPPPRVIEMMEILCGNGWGSVGEIEYKYELGAGL